MTIDKPITYFRGPFRWLSNFEESWLTYEDVVYPTAEHAYQAAKCADKEEKDLFVQPAYRSPSQAKRLGRIVKLVDDWDNKRLKVMEDILLEKFTSSNELRIKLISTGDAYLLEGNDWGDRFWGCEIENWTWVGENNLGKILMKIRGQLRKALPAWYQI